MYVPFMASPTTDVLLAELRDLIARHARPDETTAIDGVLLSAAERPGEPRASTTGTVMAVIAQGAKRLAIGDRVYDYRPGQYLVASVDLPITGHYTHASADEPALGFGLILRPPAIAALVLEATLASAPRPAAAPPGIGVADASPEFLDAVVRMVRLLDRPRDHAILAPMLEREILWRLLDGPLGQSVHQIGLSDSSLTHVSRAVRWITEHFDKPFRVEELARFCGMSTSAFHRNFQAVTALSPIQFQKQIRCCSRGWTTSPPSATASATTAPRSSAASTGGSSGCHRDATRRVRAGPSARPRADDRVAQLLERRGASRDQRRLVGHGGGLDSHGARRTRELTRDRRQHARMTTP
jgi:hypothetical protein